MLTVFPDCFFQQQFLHSYTWIRCNSVQVELPLALMELYWKKREGFAPRRRDQAGRHPGVNKDTFRQPDLMQLGMEWPQQIQCFQSWEMAQCPIDVVKCWESLLKPPNWDILVVPSNLWNHRISDPLSIPSLLTKCTSQTSRDTVMSVCDCVRLKTSSKLPDVWF